MALVAKERAGRDGKPPEGKETCELIHSSVVQRYKWPKAGKVRAVSLSTGKRPLRCSTNPRPCIIAELSVFEKTYRPEDLL